jgi:hypothetical protein
VGQDADVVLEGSRRIEFRQVVATPPVDDEAGLSSSKSAAHRISMATSSSPTTLTMVVRRRVTAGFYASQPTGSPKIPGVNLLRIGVRALAGGARKGNSALAGLGAAMVAVALLRRAGGPSRRLLYSRTLEEGESLRISVRGSKDEVRVDG